MGTMKQQHQLTKQQQKQLPHPPSILNSRTGSTCSLLGTDVAKNLGLDGPMDSVRLNGIQNVPELIVPLETRCGPKGCPVGVRTKLGWTVTGRLPAYIEDGESVYKVHIATPDEVLHETVKTWWRTENFGCRYDCDVQRSVEDEKVLKFLSERTQEVEGLYEVPLLWKDENIQLPDNRVVAIHRLGILEKRLQRDPELDEAYKKTIETDLEKGYIKRLAKEETADQAKRAWYLPHHPVLTPNKPGKVRRVCDAPTKSSCKWT